MDKYVSDLFVIVADNFASMYGDYVLVHDDDLCQIYAIPLPSNKGAIIFTISKVYRNDSKISLFLDGKASDIYTNEELENFAGSVISYFLTQ